MRNILNKAAAAGASFLLMLAALAGTAHASAITVPEIDSTSMVTAAAVLAGGYLVIVSRLRRK
jgi:hypothetical protein